MDTVLIKALQLLCCISLLVVLHEGGHFLFAKLSKVRVEKFFMFFDPYFHLFSTRDKWFTRLFPRFKTNETEYGIGWIPLGGYVKISGMIDESMDTEQMKQPAKEDEFRSKNVIQRFSIMFGGVLMNLLTAWFIYSAVMFTWGKDYVEMRSIRDGFQFNEFAQKIGFKNGDIPVATDGKQIAEFEMSIYRDIANASIVSVLRNGETVDIKMPDGGLNMLEMIQMVPAFLTPVAPAEIDSVMNGSAAEKAGITKGTRIISINDKEINTWADFDNNVTLRRMDVLSAPGCTAEDSMRMRSMKVVFARAGSVCADTATLTLDENYMMGVIRKAPVFETSHKDFSLFSAIPAGLGLGWKTLSSYVNDLKYVASVEGAKSVGSFITIGNIFPDSWNWERFWMLTAFISIILAVMNMLPIPGLDGGHIMFLLYEAVTGKRPSDKAMEWFEKIGLTVLCLLMLLALSNDFRNFILPIFGF